MFEELTEKMMEKPMQQLRASQAANKAIQMSTIHFKLTDFDKNKGCLRLEWNIFYDKKITPELIKEELKRFKELMK